MNKEEKDKEETKFDFEKICYNVRQDVKKRKTYSFRVYEVVILVIITCLLSFFAGSSIMELKLKRSNSATINSKDDKYLQQFIENYDFIVNNYYKTIDKEALINGAIEGLMSTIEDPYSIYMEDNEYDTLNISLNGSYKGLGVEIIKMDDGNLGVLTVFANSPASKAGILPGDIIISINDVLSADISSNEFSKMVIEGTETNFNLKINRNGEFLNISVIKSNVSISSVTSQVYEINNKKIGYIYISIFAMNTYDQFKENLKSLEKEGIDSLIVDVRSNTGGHLTSAENISSLFVDSSYTIYQIEQSKKKTKIKSKGNVTKKYPIVVLADSYTASASELLIGCLKDNLNATIIGTTTYGKGTVQELITLSNGDQYKITTKKWLTPKGTWINEKGIKPDIEVIMDEAYYTNPDHSTDNQLQAAFKYLTE